MRNVEDEHDRRQQEEKMDNSTNDPRKEGHEPKGQQEESKGKKHAAI